MREREKKKSEGKRKKQKAKLAIRTKKCQTKLKQIKINHNWTEKGKLVQETQKTNIVKFLCFFSSVIGASHSPEKCHAAKSAVRFVLGLGLILASGWGWD